MSFILSIISLLVLLCLSVVTGRVQLSFNTSLYFGDGYYYSFEGDTVALNCTTSEISKVGIEAIRPRWYGYDYITLVKNGLLQETSSGRYSFESSQQHNTLIIRGLSETDFPYYRCWYDKVGLCYVNWFEYFRCSVRVRAAVKLEVKEISYVTMKPNFCEIVTIDGIFFSGEDLILRCPKAELNITVSKENDKFKVEYDVNHDSQHDYLKLTVRNVTDKFNGTIISCSAETDEVETDYCRLFPNITVFNELAATMSPESFIINNGDNITLTCQSQPFLVDTDFEFDFLDNNVKLGNILETETTTGRKLLIENIDFQNATTSTFTVACRVATRSNNSSANATVTLDLKMNVTRPRESVSPLVSVVLFFVILLMFGIAVFGIIYMKVLKKKNDKGRHIGSTKKETLKANETIMAKYLYDTGDIRKVELGLTENDSEVVDNVAYVSYNGDDK